MYAIVDIEATGSPAKTNGIMEIAIVLHDGKEITGKYQTLINPRVSIPWYVARLTGINKRMVAAAPEFGEVAGNIFNLLNDKIFVAHNAGFDFPFVKHFLDVSGFDYRSKVLCTLDLSRKAFPKLPKHGLEYLCSTLPLINNSRHRAAGDAMATTELLEMIIKNGGQKLINSMIYEI